VNISKEKVKIELFPMDYVPMLNTKNMENSPSFLTITHMTLSTKRFRSYGILTIDIASEFYFSIEQWQNGSSHLGLTCGVRRVTEIASTISLKYCHESDNGDSTFNLIS
jgi:hypothetical protein